MTGFSLRLGEFFAAGRRERGDSVGTFRLRSAVEAHYAFVWRVVRRTGVREPDVDDCAQEVFLIFSRRLGSVQEGREKGFLFYTALNVASHARRTHARRREDDASGLEDYRDPGLSPDQCAEQEQARADLDRALERMPMDLRMVLILYELEQATMQEISEWLQLPVGTVASRLRRARIRFALEVHKQGVCTGPQR